MEKSKKLSNCNFEVAMSQWRAMTVQKGDAFANSEKDPQHLRLVQRAFAVYHARHYFLQRSLLSKTNFSGFLSKSNFRAIFI